MAYRSDWIRLIRALAPKYGVDPRAALAVASAEGLSGGRGDSGTSAGPFQLHRGGALPANRDYSWAESPAGIEYALRQIGGVSKGLSGRSAVENIVRRFERPADPSGEIVRALGAYGQFGGAAPGLSMSASPTAAADPSPAPDIRNAVASGLASGKPLDLLALALQAKQQPRSPMPTNKPRPAPTAQRGSGVSGKLIGLPGQGTHTLGNWESDRAIDEALPEGTPIRAPFDGVIGTQYGSLGKSGRFAGMRLHVMGANDEAYLAHLSKLTVKPGQRVRRGQIVGYSGSANGVAHLHEALRRGNPRSLVPLT